MVGVRSEHKCYLTSTFDHINPTNLMFTVLHVFLNTDLMLGGIKSQATVEKRLHCHLPFSTTPDLSGRGLTCARLSPHHSLLLIC